jgi:ABC-type nickel/cobalt efflux system permease component RcnA
MLSKKEIEFMEHWESVREEYATLKSKIKRGLPMSLLFSLPILFSIAAVQMLSPEWYTKLSQSAMNATSPILFAVILIIFFFSIARMHFKWEMNEQLFQELKQKKQPSNNPTQS